MISKILNLFKDKHIHNFILTKESLHEEFFEIYKLSKYKCYCGEIKNKVDYLNDSEIDIFIREEKFKELEL